jgi:hypothetical protein
MASSRDIGSSADQSRADLRYRCSAMVQRMLALWRRFWAGLTPRLAWDLFMVYLAVINLTLLVFDFTYLWLRPVYFNHLPVVTRIYDPVKGIEPHPLTEAYSTEAAALAEELAAGRSPTSLETRLHELRRLSAEMVERNPFERSGQFRNSVKIVAGMGRFLEDQGIGPRTAEATALEVFDRFWSLEPGPDRLRPRSEYFEANIQPLLRINFYRAFDLDGGLVDNYWWIDLPFLLIFAADFFGGWVVSLRRGDYRKWYFYPIFRWYDLLGIVPFKQFRIFRLFRIASIYVRLHRSEHTWIGDDIVSRTVRYFANIISEEISDMVALRILNETQEELAGGSHRKIIREVAEAHREGLAEQLANQLRGVLNNEAVRAEARRFLSANLEQSVESAEALRRLPVPDALLRPVVKATGQVIFDAFADTLAATLASPKGHEAVRSMARDAVDGLVSEITEGELEELVREVSIQVIEHMKQTVAVRKWMLDEQPQRTIFRRDLSD